MTASVLLRNGRLDGVAGPVDIAVTDGVVSSVGPAGEREHPSGTPVLDLEGGLVLPAFVNAHAHLDKTMLPHTATDDVEYSGGKLVAPYPEEKRAFTPERVKARARPVIRRAIMTGTTAIRSHVDIDSCARLEGLRGLLELREEYAALLDLQLVAFPYEGMAERELVEMMDEACSMGADVVGGKPYRDADFRDHIDRVVDLAARHGKDLDLHIDVDIDADPTRDQIVVGGQAYPAMQVVHLAAHVLEGGFPGRVTASHMMALDTLPAATRQGVIQLLSDAGITVVMSAACSLYVHGRKDTRATRRGVVPVRELLDAGVPVAYATDNIGDAYNLYSGPNMLVHALVTAMSCRWLTAADLSSVIEMGTRIPAGIMGLPAHGVGEGQVANLVVLDAEDLFKAVTWVEPATLVLRQGRVAAMGHRWQQVLGP